MFFSLQTVYSKTEKKFNKYELKSPLDLTSAFRKQTENEKTNKLEMERGLKHQNELEKVKELEKVEDDAEHGKRLHAWIVIISDTNRIVKKKNFLHKENIKTYFIEPSTGLVFNENDVRYLSIESVWNNENYYVSKMHCIAVFFHISN